LLFYLKITVDIFVFNKS